MILKSKRDMESWVRERSIDTMKANPYLIENDFVEVASNGYFYRVVKHETTIALNNGLYAELQPFLKASKTEYGLVKIGNGLNVEDGIVSHPDKHIPAEIATDENNRFVTDEQINYWNNKLNITDFKESIDKIVDKAIKGATWKPPVANYEELLKTYPEPEDTWTVITMDTNTIYMYDEENSDWIKLTDLMVPNLNFTNLNPCINEVGGINRGTTFDNTPIIQILHDMLYKEIQRIAVPNVYCAELENQNDYDLEKYRKRIYLKFPISFETEEMHDRHFNIIMTGALESGEEISVLDLTIHRIVPEDIQNTFGLVTDQVEIEDVFEMKPLNISGVNHILITSKKVLSGKYKFILTRDKNKTFAVTKKLMNRVRELENIIANR